MWNQKLRSYCSTIYFNLCVRVRACMYLFLLLSSSKTGVHARYPSNEAYCENCGTAYGHFLPVGLGSCNYCDFHVCHAWFNFIIYYSYGCLLLKKNVYSCACWFYCSYLLMLIVPYCHTLPIFPLLCNITRMLWFINGWSWLVEFSNSPS
ncbi:hypothetical protein OIU84_010782, partial [Salix udensis]